MLRETPEQTEYRTLSKLAKINLLEAKERTRERKDSRLLKELKDACKNLYSITTKFAKKLPESTRLEGYAELCAFLYYSQEYIPKNNNEGIDYRKEIQGTISGLLRTIPGLSMQYKLALRMCELQEQAIKKDKAREEEGREEAVLLEKMRIKPRKRKIRQI